MLLTEVKEVLHVMRTSVTASLGDATRAIQKIGRDGQAIADKLTDYLDELEVYNNSEARYQLSDYISSDELNVLYDAVQILDDLNRYIYVDTHPEEFE